MYGHLYGDHDLSKKTDPTKMILLAVRRTSESGGTGGSIEQFWEAVQHAIQRDTVELHRDIKDNGDLEESRPNFQPESRTCPACRDTCPEFRGSLVSGVRL